MKTVSVELGRRSYAINIEENLLDSAGHFIKKLHGSGSIAIITNETIAPLYAQRLLATLSASGTKAPVISLPDGEKFKTLAYIERIYSELLASGMDRKSCLIALGGGVIGDMTGFAAATFMRGIPFIQVPTTLLAQVDSSVGGKTGVNLSEGKNLAGAFHQPLGVFIDPLVLTTLDLREVRSGLAEVIKTAVIGDSGLFAYLESGIAPALACDMPFLTHIIASCCQIKARVTSMDETEQGIRAHLNFGHTIGHAIEALTDFSTFTHGEAVAMGMVAIARLCSRLGHCPISAAQRVEELILHAGLPVDLPDFPPSAYVEAILKDKKKSDSSIKLVLLKNIGEVFLQETAAAALNKMVENMLQTRGKS